jgi:hypothetical protein
MPWCSLLMLPYTLIVALFAGRLARDVRWRSQNTVLFSHYTALAALAGFALIWLFPMVLGHG